MTAMDQKRVLVAGAGPTGLVFALALTRLGIPVRIVDEAAEPGTTSRALAVQGRTLEFYRMLGIAERVMADGTPVRGANLWVSGKRRAHLSLGDMGRGVSLFATPMIYPQDQHERMLIEELGKRGVEVERPTELLGFEESGECLRARLRRRDGSEEIFETPYIAGCDGAHSAVREQLQFGFPGGIYEHLFYVADIEATGDVLNGELHAALGEEDFLVVFPMKKAGTARLVGAVRSDAAATSEASDRKLGWEDVSKTVLGWLRIDVKKVNWFSSYRVHHRVAEHFRRGRAFLLGDAAHIHSPVGGQGMNTGIGDAMNLAWKMAGVLRRRVAPEILDTYEPERIAFARRLVATTDRAFTAVTSSSTTAKFVRLDAVPVVLPILARFAYLRREAYLALSQAAIEYRESELSRGCAGEVQGGDRLPWFEGANGGEDNFAPLGEMDWQVQVYGQAAEGIRGLCGEHGVRLVEFAWSERAEAAGFARDAAYLVRPDGYVALANGGSASLADYFARWMI